MTSINHLLFMDDLKFYGTNKDQLDSLIQVVRIFSQDIKTSFVLEMCAVLEIRRGRQVHSSGIDLPDDQHIGEIGEEGYKYLQSWTKVLTHLSKTNTFYRRSSGILKSIFFCQ